MEDFRKLTVWEKSHALSVVVYQVTRAFPRDEMYGLTAQIRRATVSIEANIAEGCGRRSDGEMHRFLQIARGSASEVECHLLLAKDLGFLSVGAFAELEANIFEIQRMLASLSARVRNSGARS